MSTITPDRLRLDDPNLWQDPFADDPKITGGSVLLAEAIKAYVEKNILINKDDFKFGKLKGASYTMYPDSEGAWIMRSSCEADGEDIEERLPVTTDSEGDHYLVPKNSLVFIRLRTQLRIPFYMIGRHNLKIRYVYKGLLLGTGPQVDPGYVGNLIIPLHNLTTKDVRVYIDQSFVSIDFVRTTNLFSSKEERPVTFEEFYKTYGESKCLLETQKIAKRTSLASYLEGSKPRSKLAEFQEDINKWNAQFDKYQNEMDRKTLELQTFADKVRTWAKIEYLVIAAVLITLLSGYATLVFHFDKKFTDFQNSVKFQDTSSIDPKYVELTNQLAAFAQTENLNISNLELQISRDETKQRSAAIRPSMKQP